MIAGILERLNFGGGEALRLQGITASAQSFLIAALFENRKESLLVLAADQAEAERISGDIAFYLNKAENIIQLPQYETLPYEPLSPHIEVSSARALALRRLSAGSAEPFICVTTKTALRQRCAPPSSFAENNFALEKGKEADIEALKNYLQGSGYIFFDPVEEPGTFAFRGGILDIFPPSMERPLRVEFFGDEVESIRSFNMETQRSHQYFESAEIAPIRETDYEQIDREFLFKKLSELEERHSADLSETKTRFEEGAAFPAMEHYLPWFNEDSWAPYDFLPGGIKVIECEPERIAERDELLQTEIDEGYIEALERKEYYPPPDELYLDSKMLSKSFGNNILLKLSEISTEEEGANSVQLPASEPFRYRGEFSRFIYDCRQLLAESNTSLIVVSSTESAERMKTLFNQEDVGVAHIDSSELPRIASSFLSGEPPEPRVLTVSGSLSSGFASRALRFSVTTEEEIFGRHQIKEKRKPRRESVYATDFSDIAPGDYVVHRDHGVSVFHGTKLVSAGSSESEYLELEFAEDQRLFLPIASVNLLEKYSGAGGSKPSLDRMGGKTWLKTKEKVRKNILRMAKELLAIYAKRKTGKAFAYNVKSSSNIEFAETFEYIETRDQISAIEDVMNDLASDQPMDRLVCGDVGYGKTEIAMRAGFAVTVEGKQTAVLAPTTLLVKQHYQNFKKRMESFGVRVEMLSRFVNDREQTSILKDLELGKIDIIIGTHKILQKDVKFQDLGLVIIDEEQRFGVSHKEKLKKLRETVDVLTLSATPIPRTLQMSLSGIRSISVINSPPAGRRSIKTFIRRSSDHIIKEAVNREMSRGGQVFFVHNSVETISSLHRYLNEVVPKARIAIGHGQMSGPQLEDVMEKFVKHKIDILLCTTIIESGLDIPNANTIIVNRADKFGLAQLYQLRGRVGRDKHRAYAYMLVPDSLSPLARKRIAAIEELSDLGSSFKLAARDMEIRGAGNLLGPQQSGQVTAVGFETYCRMLEEAVLELQTGKAQEKIDTELDIDFIGKLEKSYIPVLEQRMNYYNRLNGAKDSDDIRQTIYELEDRYGPLPEKAKKLADAANLKILGSRLGIQKLSLKGNSVTLNFAPSSEHAVSVTAAAGRKFTGNIRPVGDSSLYIDMVPLKSTERIAGLSGILEEAMPVD